MCQSAFLLLAEEPSDGGFDAFLLGLLVEGVLAAGYTTQGAGLGLQRGHDPADAKNTQKTLKSLRYISISFINL